MPEEKLHRTQVARLLLDLRRFRDRIVTTGPSRFQPARPEVLR